MNEIERLVQWLQTCPGFNRVRALQVDFLGIDPETLALNPSGLTELSRREDLSGGVWTENMYRFALRCNLAAADPIGNAAWLLSLQRWVQEQSVRHLAPMFGDAPENERVTAQNGVFLAQEEETAVYRVEITIYFKKYYEVI